MPLENLKAEAAKAVDAMKAELLALSHAIHGEPELAFQEFKAAKRLTEAVESHDVAVARAACGIKTAFAAEFGKNGGATVAILSEYDALPGIGHSCGHNVIAAAGFGAAMALSKLGAALPGRVRYLGTPAEERFGGKEYMARAGAFDGVDAAMMIHPASIDMATMPCIAISEVDVVYRGRAAHASAMPHRGLNALDAVMLAYQAIAALRQHIKATERIHGIITEGGLAPNIVPERTACRFYVRAADVHELLTLRKRVHACFDAGARATGCEADIVWGEANYLDLKTNWPIARAFEKNAGALGRKMVPTEKIPPFSSGSTDMGNVSHRVPSIHPMLAVAPPDVIIHNPEFARWAASERGDAAVIDGAKALAMTALDVLANRELRDHAKGDFAASEDVSRLAIAQAFRARENGHSPAHAHGHGACGCL